MPPIEKSFSGFLIDEPAGNRGSLQLAVIQRHSDRLRFWCGVLGFRVVGAVSDRQFSHPNTGREVRIEQNGREVRLIIVCGSRAGADVLCTDILNQLKAGALNLTLMGKPSSVEES